MENLPEEIQQPDEDNGSLLKKKTKKIKDPTQPKKVLTEGQKKALTAMNDARIKKAEEKLKLKYMKIIEKEQKANPVAKPVVIPTPAASSLAGMQPDPESDSSSSSEEVQVITKPKRIKNKEPKKKKKTKKIIVMQDSSSESESESEPEIIYQSRPMKSQQNRRSLIQQHNEKQTQKNFFCN